MWLKAFAKELQGDGPTFDLVRNFHWYNFKYTCLRLFQPSVFLSSEV
ncbi:hypothetical protein Gotur_026548, partial [Gossypium turneri]